MNRDAQFSGGCGPIPPRWLQCPRKSVNLVAGKFLAFKTPLGPQFDSEVDIAWRFPPEMLFSSMKSHKVELGLWIDLTNTSRFYNKNLVENDDHNCSYLKLQCRGHGETPSIEQTRTFVKVCTRFIKQNPLKILGVHCTHGFNRTGFMIVSYLVDSEDWSIEAAIRTFAQARPPGIYKQDYLEELFRRYSDISETLPAPALPDWHTGFDDEDDEQEVGEKRSNGYSKSDGPPTKRPKREMVKKNPVFMEGVPGVVPITVPHKLTMVQKKVQKLCEWNSTGFPGSQPVSMDLQNVNFLQEKSYKVSWKADGSRYMMLIDGENEVYFIDRDNCVFQVAGLKFPNRKEPRHIRDTLLDGEMVLDHVDKTVYPRYLIYDIVHFEGLQVGKTNFSTRLTCIHKELITPRTSAIIEGKIDKTLEPFGVRAKEFYDVTCAASLLGPKFRANLSHEPDGLIFQPSHDAYLPGRCDAVLKWKPLSMNSVDFRLKITPETRPGMPNTRIGFLYVGGLDPPFAEMKVVKVISALDNKIIECKYEAGKWVFMRERTDKSFPNSYNTAKGVCQSIQNPVTQEYLLEFIASYRYRKPGELDMLPPPPPVVR